MAVFSDLGRRYPTLSDSPDPLAVVNAFLARKKSEVTWTEACLFCSWTGTKNISSLFPKEENNKRAGLTWPDWLDWPLKKWDKRISICHSNNNKVGAVVIVIIFQAGAVDEGYDLFWVCSWPRLSDSSCSGSTFFCPSPWTTVLETVSVGLYTLSTVRNIDQEMKNNNNKKSV